MAIKNDKLSGDLKASKHGSSHRILRVIMAAAGGDNQKISELYTAFGIPFQAAGFEFDDELIKDVLKDNNLDENLLSAADDPSYDEEIHQSMRSALDVTGEDVGVPIIVFTDENGQRRGFFGPVLDALPSDEESLKLWDGLSAMASSSHFFELKRSRKDSDGPNIGSTARC